MFLGLRLRQMAISFHTRRCNALPTYYHNKALTTGLNDVLQIT